MIKNLNHCWVGTKGTHSRGSRSRCHTCGMILCTAHKTNHLCLPEPTTPEGRRWTDYVRDPQGNQSDV